MLAHITQLTAIALLFGLLSHSVMAEEKQPETEKKPEIVVADDGFPAGHSTPEGAACDLARAFIRKDAALFKTTCIAPFGGGENREAYEQFLKKVTASIEAEAKKETPSPGGPKTIRKLYAARHLSKNGPGSLGFALYDFQSVMFADVDVELVAGQTIQNRTLLIRKKDGKWYVHPAPHTARLLSVGLNDEEASTTDFKEAYTVTKPKPDEETPAKP